MSRRLLQLLYPRQVPCPTISLLQIISLWLLTSQPSIKIPRRALGTGLLSCRWERRHKGEKRAPPRLWFTKYPKTRERAREIKKLGSSLRPADPLALSPNPYWPGPLAVMRPWDSALLSPANQISTLFHVIGRSKTRPVGARGLVPIRPRLAGSWSVLSVKNKVRCGLYQHSHNLMTSCSRRKLYR